MNAKQVQRIEQFVAKLQARINAYWKDQGFTYGPAPVLVIEYGRKNARIVKSEGGRRSSVHCFIEIETGNVLKAATFKAPAPNGVRGNIYDKDFGMSCVGVYGVNYIRGPKVAAGY